MDASLRAPGPRFYSDPGSSSRSRGSGGASRAGAAPNNHSQGGSGDVVQMDPAAQQPPEKGECPPPSPAAAPSSTDSRGGGSAQASSRGRAQPPPPATRGIGAPATCSTQVTGQPPAHGAQSYASLVAEADTTQSILHGSERLCSGDGSGHAGDSNLPSSWDGEAVAHSMVELEGNIDGPDPIDDFGADYPDERLTPNNICDTLPGLMPTSPCSNAEQEPRGSQCETGLSEAEEGYRTRKKRRWVWECAQSRHGPVMTPIDRAVQNAATRTTEHIFEPSLGDTFRDETEAFQLYNTYAWEVGFSARYSKSITKHKGDPEKEYRSMQEFCCWKGKTNEGAKKSTKLCGCPARIRLIRNDKHELYVSIFTRQHNHPLVAGFGERSHLPSHKHIDLRTRDLVRSLRENNVRLGKVNSIIGGMQGATETTPRTRELVMSLRENNVCLGKVNSIVGGMQGATETTPFTKKAIKVACTEIAHDHINNDVAKTLELFKRLQDEDNDFAYALDLDEDDTIRSIMWCSARGRRMYKCFGDAITFDTTYKTNIYGMPFGMFVGVDNHFHSVVFGGVLLTSETTQSFEWVFSQFLKMMDGAAPETILTDQCLAMGAAIRSVLPNTRHRWCKWHVLKKIRKLLAHLETTHKDFAKDFNIVVNHMLTTGEFKGAWAWLLKTYGLEDNPLLRRAYEARKLWAKPYFRDVFCARMSSTQSGESANFMLKNIVPPKSPMNQFVESFIKFEKDRVEIDCEAQKNNSQKSIKLTCGYPIESHAAKLYTQTAFALFTEELVKSTQYVLAGQEETTGLYVVRHFEGASREPWARVTFKIEVLGHFEQIKCQCGLYEHFGLLCCHALRLLICKGVCVVPPAHIKKRWTRDARDILPTKLDQPNVTISGEIPVSLRQNLLYMCASELAYLGCSDQCAFDIAMKHLSAAKREIQEHIAHQVQLEAPTSAYASESDAPADSEAEQLHVFDNENNICIDVERLKAPAVPHHPGRPTTKCFMSRPPGAIR